jgi:hypothetical protein
LTVQV